jgi:uncharacterized protein (TIGR00369 family)
VTDQGEKLDGIEVMRQFLANSPFAVKLGIEVVELSADFARLRLPTDPSLATAGEIVHGGAVSTLADTAATAACWTAADIERLRSGATVSLTVDYLEAASGTLEATAQVTRRGSLICFAEVDVNDSADRLVAKALATYRFLLARSSS